MVMGVIISRQITFVVCRLIINEGYSTINQGKTADNFIFRLLDFLLSLVVLCLWGGSLLQSGKLLYCFGVEVDAFLLKFDERIDISSNNKVVIFILIYQHLNTLLQLYHLFLIFNLIGGQMNTAEDYSVSNCDSWLLKPCMFFSKIWHDIITIFVSFEKNPVQSNQWVVSLVNGDTIVVIIFKIIK